MRKVRTRGGYGACFLFWFIAQFPAVTGAYAQQLASDTAVRRCATMEAYHFGLQGKKIASDPLRAVNERITEVVRNRRNLRVNDTEIIRIPVVVHVIHNQSSGKVGGRGNPNISEEQILSQIRILNEDYRKQAGTPGYNTDPVGVDTRIEFFLAELDPDGSATNGITRHYYSQKSTFNPYGDEQLIADIVSWPTDEYLNIWVCTLSGVYLGVAQFPSVTGIPGLDDLDKNRATTDGVIIDYRSFGDVGAVETNNYNKGRTTTHEVGHWFGLIHIWGDERCGDDYCADTPKAESSNTSGCNDVYSRCSGAATLNMIENYMDYSPDRCMNIFTYNQMERMHAVLALSPRRIRLVENSKKARLEESETLRVTIQPNPLVSKLLEFKLQHKGYRDVDITIIDAQGKAVHVSRYEKVWSRIFKIPVQNLTPGIYLLQILGEDNEKFIGRFAVI